MRASALCFLAIVSACGASFGLPRTDASTWPPGSTSNGDVGAMPSPTTGPATQMETDIVRYTNDARRLNGLPELRLNSQLLQAARIQARQMAERQQLQHDIPGAQYPDLASRLASTGYTYSRAAENIAWNTQSPQAVVNGWMNSSGHRANILDGRLTEIGAAMARSSKGEPYWIQVFAAPR